MTRRIRAWTRIRWCNEYLTVRLRVGRNRFASAAFVRFRRPTEGAAQGSAPSGNRRC